MASFDLTYDADEDVLEVAFEVFDEGLARTISLNDHIFLFTDPGLQSVWSLTVYSYSQLLGVSETELTTLLDVPEEQLDTVLSLLCRPPASHFFEVTDPALLIARVRAPGLHELLSSDLST